MRFEIVEKLKKFIKDQRESEKGHYDEMNKNLAPFKVPALSRRYTADGLKQTILEIMSTCRNKCSTDDARYNQGVQELIGNVVNEVQKMIEPKFKKPADYATQIANAMKFIELEGKDITDDTAFMVLADFISDHAQMNRFRHMIQKQKGVESLLDWNGKTTFPMTFSALQQHDDIKHELTTLSENGAAMFLTKKDSSIQIFAGMRYEIPSHTPFNPDKPFYTFQELAALDSAKRLEALLSGVEESDELATLEGGEK